MYICDCSGYKCAPTCCVFTSITTVILATNVIFDFMCTMFIMPCLIGFSIIIIIIIIIMT
jgi:hypothetical protein